MFLNNLMNVIFENDTDAKIPTVNPKEKYLTLKTKKGRREMGDEIENKSEQIPEYVKTLVKGKGVYVNTNVPFEKPEWFDEEKYRLGQRFACKHIFSVFFAELLNLLCGLLFAIQGTFEPMVFTGQSDTPIKSFRRYISTVVRVKSWYEGDIWDPNSEAHKNINKVRTMHRIVKNQMNNLPEQEVSKRISLQKRDDNVPLLTNFRDELSEDFAKCPLFKYAPTHPCTENNSKIVYFNQCDMAFTQSAFAGFILVNAHKFGVHGVSREDLEGFAHFWRTIGYLLGAEDEYNLCNETLENIQQRIRDSEERFMNTIMSPISSEGIHMARCVTEGMGFLFPLVSFEFNVLFMSYVLGVKLTQFGSVVKITHYCTFILFVFIIKFLFKVPGIRQFFNWCIITQIERATVLSKSS